MIPCDLQFDNSEPAVSLLCKLSLFDNVSGASGQFEISAVKLVPPLDGIDRLEFEDRPHVSKNG